jgi:hypothetical protein
MQVQQEYLSKPDGIYAEGWGGGGLEEEEEAR